METSLIFASFLTFFCNISSVCITSWICSVETWLQLFLAVFLQAPVQTISRAFRCKLERIWGSVDWTCCEPLCFLFPLLPWQLRPLLSCLSDGEEFRSVSVQIPVKQAKQMLQEEKVYLITQGDPGGSASLPSGLVITLSVYAAAL